MPAVLPVVIQLLGGGIDSAIVLSAAPGGAAMLAAIAAAVLFMTLAVASYARPGVAAAALQPAAVRHRTEQTVFLALCDPGAAGRPRPRAPSAHYRAV